MKRLTLLIICALTLGLTAMGRRTVTPVTTDLPGHNYLTDSLPGDQFIDSIAKVQPKAIGNIYPLMDAVEVSVDIWPAVYRAFRSGYGIAGLEAQLSLHNRYFPSLEAGLSSASYTPAGMNYSFRSPLAPYFKIGMDYNFLYNSDPAYKVFALVRYGISAFDYQFTNVTLTSNYWDTSSTIDFPNRRSICGYLEIGAGLQVKLFGPLSAGWSVRYHLILHHNSEPNGVPWAIPGFGPSSSAIGLTVSLTYTIPLHSPVIQNPEHEKD